MLTHRHLQNLQAAQMIQMSSSDVFQDPHDVLALRLSFSRRLVQRSKTGMDLTEVWSQPVLLSFGNSQDSRMLFVTGSIRQQHQSLVVGSLMTDFIKAAGLCVLSVFQTAGLSAKVKTTASQVIKFLAMQALKATGDDLSHVVSGDFNSARIASASGNEQWERILMQALRPLDCVYAVIDLDVLQDQHEALMLVRSLEKVVKECPTVFKIVLLGWCANDLDTGSRPGLATLKLDSEPGLMAMMGRRRPAGRGRGGRHGAARAGARFTATLSHRPQG